MLIFVLNTRVIDTGVQSRQNVLVKWKNLQYEMEYMSCSRICAVHKNRLTCIHEHLHCLNIFQYVEQPVNLFLFTFI